MNVFFPLSQNDMGAFLKIEPSHYEDDEFQDSTVSTSESDIANPLIPKTIQYGITYGIRK